MNSFARFIGPNLINAGSALTLEAGGFQG